MLPSTKKPFILPFLRPPVWVFSWSIFLAVTGACESTENPKYAVVEGDVLLQTENNYSSALDLKIDNIDFDPAQEVTVDWSQVATGTNLRQQPVTSVDLVVIAQVRGDHATIESYIEQGTPLTTLVTQQYPTTAGQTTAMLGQIVSQANFFTTPNVSFLATFSKGTSAGDGTQALSFITPVTGGATSIQVPPGSAQLQSFTPQFGQSTLVPASNPGSLGWGSVAVDSQGNMLTAIRQRDVNRVLLAFFEAKQPAELENQASFFQLETLATTLYQADVTHPGAEPTTAVQLSTLVNRVDNSPFQRFVQGGTWIFAAMCDVCNNPALVLTVLEPVGE